LAASVTGFGRIRGLAILAVACASLACAGAALASPHPSTNKVIRYRGMAVRIPSSWPVFDLARSPQTCVRFDRHALYLGQPGAQQQCPASPIGRTEAILIAPLSAKAASGSRAGGAALSGSLTSFVTHGATVTATWSSDPGLIKTALGRRTLPSPSAIRALPRARAANIRPAQASVYTGPGFDTCATPSTAAMSAWSSSPYRAVGVYIGGENAACLGGNLTAAWVSAEIAAGWHLIPTFVGLQAPSSSCGGCAAINPSQATAQGTADAETAVTEAQALGLPSGSVLYDDMEQYNRGSSSPTVLAYLSGWTTQLHVEGYGSGVYSSGSSGITDLVTRWGTGYTEPDVVWDAEWNYQANTVSAYIPAADWADHQRIHQYAGAHKETHGGATINIDSDYMDAPAENLPPPPAPSLSVSAASSGITNLRASWPREPGIATWQVLGGPSPTSLSAVGYWPASQNPIPIRGTSAYFEVQALGSAGQVLGASPAVATPAHLAVFGRNAYVSQTTGNGVVPVGCYTDAACQTVTTISVGAQRISRVARQSFNTNSAGVVHFSLNRWGLRMLRQARGGRLLVTASVRDYSGKTASVHVTLVRYVPGPSVGARQERHSATLRITGLTAFVTRYGAVSALVGCRTIAMCLTNVTLSVGRTVIARPHSAVVGAHELGYISFPLNAAGKAMLSRAHGTLGAHLVLSTSSGGPATAKVQLLSL
jgi:hypothetical protein